jgi:hypothetical protein
MASRLERTECSRVMQTAQDGSRVDSSKHGHKEVENKYAIPLFTHCCPFKFPVCSGFSVSIMRTSCYSRLTPAGSLSLFWGITSCHDITLYSLASSARSAIRRSVAKLRERDTRWRTVHWMLLVVGPPRRPARPRNCIIADSNNRTSSPARVDQQLNSLAIVTHIPKLRNETYTMV